MLRRRIGHVLLALPLLVACGGKEGVESRAQHAPAEPPVARVTPVPAPPSSAAKKAPPAHSAGAAEDRHGLPAASCPLAGDSARDPDQLLDMAARRYARRDWMGAFGCAEIASDLVPTSVEAHHIRASALAQLGHHEAAQVAFALALALDPDDPETLAAAANFYINILPRLRDTLLVGLAHARRGSRRADSRRRRDRALRARLSLLQAQALTDLGSASQALRHVATALTLSPKMIAARYERGVALFHLCKFAAAQRELARVLRRSPDDPYAHYHMGLIYERTGRAADARAHFRRARDLANDEFPEPVQIRPEEFAAQVERAVRALPAAVRDQLRAVSIETEDLPRLADLTATDPPFSPTILGLYRGLPLGVPSRGPERPLARAIVLYRRNLVRAVRTREGLDRQILRTLQHEIGHLRGMDEDALRHRGLD